jgi:hypothetical protein
MERSARMSLKSKLMMPLLGLAMLITLASLVMLAVSMGTSRGWVQRSLQEHCPSTCSR